MGIEPREIALVASRVSHANETKKPSSFGAFFAPLWWRWLSLERSVLVVVTPHAAGSVEETAR